MLGLEPTGEHLVVDPALPLGIGRIELLDIPGRWGRVDAFARGRINTDSPRRFGRELGVQPERKPASKDDKHRQDPPQRR
jgi:hypothetical protein